MKLFAALSACFVAHVAASNNTTTSTSAGSTESGGGATTSVEFVVAYECATGSTCSKSAFCTGTTGVQMTAAITSNAAVGTDTPLCVLACSRRRLEEVEDFRRLATNATVSITATLTYSTGTSVGDIDLQTAKLKTGGALHGTFVTAITAAATTASGVTATGVTGISSTAAAAPATTTTGADKSADVSGAILGAVTLFAFLLNRA